MKKMKIFEPAMCCSTGVCGVGVDPELLRITTAVNNVNERGLLIERYNLSTTPQAFISHKKIGEMISTRGVGILPVVLVDNEVVITGRYPTNEEIAKYLEIPISKVVNNKKSFGGGCCGGCC